MPTSRKKLFELIYKGFDHEEAQHQELLFWRKVPMEDKLEIITDMITRDPLTGKVNPNAQRLLRTTAVIKRT
jgi:hypothetical protein